MAYGLKIASLTLATILIASTMSIALAQDAEAMRKVATIRIVDTPNNGYAAVCVGKLLEADTTIEYAVKIDIFEAGGSTPIASEIGIVNQAEPKIVVKNPGVSKFIVELNTAETTFTSKLKALNLDPSKEYQCTIALRDNNGPAIFTAFTTGKFL